MSQTRRMVIAVLASVAVFYTWMLLATKMGWMQPPAPQTRPAATAPAEAPLPPSTQPSTAPAQAVTPPPAIQAPAGTQPSIGGAFVLVGGETDQKPITLGSAERDNPFPMSVELLPEGATVGVVHLRGFYETVKREQPYMLLEPVTTPSGQRFASFETLKVRFETLKMDVPLDDAVWKLAETSPERVVFTIDIKTSDGKPLARVFKVYELPKQPPGKKPGQPETYDLRLSIRVENLSGSPQSIILVQDGPVGVRREDLRAEDRRIVTAMFTGDKIVAKGRMASEATKDGLDLGADAEATRIAWVAEANKYFAAIMTPTGRENASAPPLFAVVEAVALTSGTEQAGQPGANTLRYVTLPRTIPAAGSEQLSFSLYLGPKSKRVFQEIPEYARLDYYWVMRESFTWCTPAGLVSLMMRLLDIFHRIPPHNYGIAIIILVLLVRTILHPITKRSQVNMTRMQRQMATLQPKVEAAKQKYANDKAMQNQAVMEAYREAGINPAGQFLNCLPMALQVPIWIALWTALSSTIEMRHEPFDGYWIKDLAGPDVVYAFAQPLHIPLLSWLIGGPLTSINILPILLGISQLLQTKYMPRGTPAAQQPSGQPDQLEQQRKIMMFMSIVFVLFLYNAPSGLNLYIMASNFFGILEQWRIRQHLAELEKKAPAPAAGGPGSSPGSAPGSVPKSPPAKPRQPSWFERKWQDLQKAADEAKRVESQRREKKGKPRR